jgi:hypothetical protein
VNRFDIERAVQRSGLPAAGIAIVMALCTRISADSGAIEPEYSPSLRSLARMTGYAKSTVCEHLQFLELAGWITRNRHDPAEAGRLHLTTVYELSVPCPATGHKPVRRPASPRPAPGRGPVRPADGAVSGGRTPTSRDRESVRDSTEIVTDDDAALVLTAQRELAELTGRTISLQLAAEAVRLVLDGRQISNRKQYLLRSLRDDPRRFIPAADQSAQAQADYYARAKARSEAIANPTQKKEI